MCSDGIIVQHTTDYDTPHRLDLPLRKAKDEPAGSSTRQMPSSNGPSRPQAAK